MKIITLLTDFGLLDGYPGIMKGVIYRINPDVQIVDITHLIAPQNIYEGALAISRSYRYFPENTIHVAVVDPGVGTKRRPIAAKIGLHTFVGPDNGLLTLLLDEAKENSWPVEIVHLNNTQFWLPSPSSVFHGRDVFAPVAAHLSNGAKLQNMGILINDPVHLDIVPPQRSGNKLFGHIIHVDHFGNMTTDIRKDALPAAGRIIIKIGSVMINKVSMSYGEVAPGEWIALMDSSGYLSICVANGSAAKQLNSGVGCLLEISLDEPV